MKLSTYEFDVRVPAESLTQADLRKVTIALYRVKEPRPPMTVGRMPLSMQFQRELREVARLDGISSKALPELLRRPRTSPLAIAARRGSKTQSITRGTLWFRGWLAAAALRAASSFQLSSRAFSASSNNRS